MEWEEFEKLAIKKQDTIDNAKWWESDVHPMLSNYGISRFMPGEHKLYDLSLFKATIKSFVFSSPFFIRKDSDTMLRSLGVDPEDPDSLRELLQERQNFMENNQLLGVDLSSDFGSLTDLELKARFDLFELEREWLWERIHFLSQKGKPQLVIESEIYKLKFADDSKWNLVSPSGKVIAENFQSKPQAQKLLENINQSSLDDEYWTVPPMWSGNECWLIGGGSSMPRQFGVPEDIIMKVQNRELPVNAYSPYLTLLHQKNVIGINMAYRLGNWISMTYFSDNQFCKYYLEDLVTSFSNLKVTSFPFLNKSLLPLTKNVKRLRREQKQGFSEKRDSIAVNYSSGAACINLAAHTGVKKVYLLGFDMKAIKENTHYQKGVLYSTPVPNDIFQIHLKSFPFINADAKKMGIEIININPDSAIDCFPKLNLKDVL